MSENTRKKDEKPDIKDKATVICIDETTLIPLTQKLEQNLLALQENIKELKRHVIGASGRKRYRNK